MKAYVINLENRPDRWESVLIEAMKLGIPILRVDAVRKDGVSGVHYAAPGVAATSLSHKKAMLAFLESTDDFAIIAEDDFEVSKKYSLEKIDFYSKAQFDFIQLGFLRTSPFKSFAIYATNLIDLFLKLLGLSDRLPLVPNSIKQKLLVREQRNIPWSLVLNDIRPGGHFYLISRNFAEAAVKFNDPVFLSADGAFMSLGWMRTFKMARVRGSLVNQSDSKSSVEDRFISIN